MSSKHKRVMQLVMSQLDEEVEKGHVQGGAHLRLSKRLKAAFDAPPPDEKKAHVEQFMLDFLKEAPMCAMNIPFKYKDLVENPEFLRRLIHAKRKDKDGTTDKWWAELMDGILPEFVFESTASDWMRQMALGSLSIVLLARWNVLVPVQRHLDNLTLNLKLKPVDICPIAGVHDDHVSVWNVLDADARFIGWLLKDDCGGYTPEEVSRLREFAFDRADKTAHRDAGWLRALGLKDMSCILTVEMHRAIGCSFNDARAIAMARQDA